MARERRDVQPVLLLVALLVLLGFGGPVGSAAGPQPNATLGAPTPTAAATATSTLTPIPSPTAASTSTATPTATLDPRDGYEPDDVVPKPIIAGVVQVHNFFPVGDVDQVTFLAKSGRYYRVSTSGLALGADTLLTVHLGTSVFISDDRSPGDLSSSLMLYVAGASDVQALVVVSNRGIYSADMVYQLSLEEIIPTATPTCTNTPAGTATPTFTPDLRDAYEPDDLTPAGVILGVAQVRNFYPAGDVDWATFVAKAGRAYRISTYGLALGVDTVLTVQVGTAVYRSDDRGPGDLSSLIDFHGGLSDAQALIRVTNLGLYGADKVYQLLAEEILPTGTPTHTPTPSNTPTPTPLPWDAYDPDDTVPREILLGVPQVHTFSPAGDIDRVWFRALAGHSYRVVLSDEAPGVDAYMILMINELPAPPEGGRPGQASAMDSELVIQVGPDRDVEVVVEVRNVGSYGPDMYYRLAASEILFTPTPSASPTRTPTRTSTLAPSSTPSPTADPAVALPAWRRVALAGRTVRDLAIHPGNADVVMVSVAGPDLGVFLAEDGGATWRSATTGLDDLNVYRLVREPAAPWVAYATSVDRLWKSADGGSSWTAVDPGGSFSGISGLAAAPALAGRTYLVTWGPCSVFASNGGSAWVRNAFVGSCAEAPFESAMEVSSLRADVLYLSTAHDRPEVYRSGDAGWHWDRLTDVAGGAGVYDLALDPLDDRHVYAGTNGSGVYVTVDSGLAWGPMNNGLPGGGVGAQVTAFSADLSSAGYLYAAVRGAGIYRAETATQWWLPYGSFPSGPTVYALRASPLRRERLWAATSDGVWVMEPARYWLPMVLKSACFQDPCAHPTATFTPVPPATATPRPYPYPLPTTPAPGASPTSTSAPGATATLSPSPAPTATPTLSDCDELVANGGFETDSAWRIGNTPRRAAYTTAVYRSGGRSMRLGILPPDANAYSYSSAYQTITIPGEAASAILRLWWRRHSEEVAAGERLSPEEMGERPALQGETMSVASANAYGDVQEVLLLDPTYYTTVAVLQKTLVNDAGWTMATYDLTHWRGRRLVLYFNAYNDGLGGRTWMYVDDVSVEACKSDCAGD